MGEVDWHNPPQRILVLWPKGEVEFETSDGDIRRLPAGSVVLAEDTTGMADTIGLSLSTNPA
jgi:hypothetical protein